MIEKNYTMKPNTDAFMNLPVCAQRDQIDWLFMCAITKIRATRNPKLIDKFWYTFDRLHNARDQYRYVNRIANFRSN